MDSMIGHRVLLVRTRSWLCALRMMDIIETMRALPIVPFGFGPSFLSGLSIVRGAPVPVVNLAKLFGAQDDAQSSRFVAMRCGSRRFCLEVDEVVGVTDIDVAQLEKAPPLLSGAVAEYVERLGVLDGEVLVTLTMARLIPEEVWNSLMEQEVR